MHTLVHRTAVVAALTLFAGCADAPTQPDLSIDAARNKDPKGGGGGAGTTLVASKSAIGFHEVQTEYDWTLEKKVKLIMGEGMAPEPSTTTTQITPGSVVRDGQNIKWVDYLLIATRSENPTVTTTGGVRGEICVRNAGERPTEGLAIRDVVQRKSGGDWADVATEQVDVAAKPVLGAGEQFCYPYEIDLPATPGEYRNTAFVTITNHSGHLGEPFGPAFNGGGIKAGFTIPSQANEVVLDESARIWEPGWEGKPESYVRGGCAELWPLMFCMQGEGHMRWEVSESTTFEFMIDIGNLYACGDSYVVNNTAQLTESGHGDFAEPADTRFATVSFEVTTKDCLPAIAPVRNAAFWSQGTGWPPHQFWGATFKLQDYLFFDTGNSWLQQIRLTPTTAYQRLAREFIATTLNFANRAAVPASVMDVRNQVAAYFASWPSERASVSDAQLEAWRSVLAAFNESGS